MSAGDFTGVALVGPLVVGRGNDPRTGPTITYQWRGRQAEVEEVEVAQIALGRRTELKIPADSATAWVLDVTAGAEDTQPENEPLSNQWSLKRNLVEQEIWRHPKIKTILDGLLESVPLGADDPEGIRQGIARMKRDFDAFVKGDEKTETNTEREIDLTQDVLAGHLILLGLDRVPGAVNTFMEFLNARLQGVDSFPTYSWVLKRTTVVARNTGLRPDKDNVGKMFTKDTLKSQEDLDDPGIIGDLPDGYWLKIPAEVERTAADKWTFEQEYWHAETFSKFLYGEAI